MHCKLLDFPSSPSYCQTNLPFFFFFFNSMRNRQSSATRILKMVPSSKQVARLSNFFASFLSLHRAVLFLEATIESCADRPQPSSSPSFAFQVCSEEQNRSLSFMGKRECREWQECVRVEFKGLWVLCTIHCVFKDMQGHAFPHRSKMTASFSVVSTNWNV